MPLDSVVNKVMKCNDALYVPWNMDAAEKLTRKLGKSILETYIKEKKELPGIIIGIGTGGEYLAEWLKTEMGIHEKLVLTSQEKGSGEQKKVEVVCDLNGSARNKYVLLVIDVADTGETLSFVKKYLEGEEKGARSVTTVALACKQKNVFKPDFYGMEVKGRVIVPWGEEIKEIITESYKKGNFETIRKLFTTEEIKAAIGKEQP
ncbi:MAG: hypoxanthine phosphoribosyltransferase [Promethearchaeota archaeon CR_4]|nr:MAG: hypoxanthine phosphoribosyltransferase [Candidatus Lokiarchaeota archaeon CR_4]